MRTLDKSLVRAPSKSYNVVMWFYKGWFYLYRWFEKGGIEGNFRDNDV